MKQLRKFYLAIVLAGSLTLALSSCKSGPKDTDIKTQIIGVLPEGVTIDVKKGEAVLTGEFKDDLAKQEAEKAIKAIPGVKNVVDNATIKPVEISADTDLINKVNEVIKNYQGATIDVKDGVITLSGELNKVDLPKLMQEISALHPKKVENKLTLK